jgi:cation diffusion facilitator CzcD-associated flavoprotein CzcO
MDSQGVSENLLDAIIIGAGMSGICAAYQLKKAGYKDLVILEKSDGVGGTWHDNIYPGSGCDVPSHLYSYSFALNPNWSRVFSRQDEIKAYFEKCVDDFGLRPALELNTEVASAQFDDTSQTWRVEAKDGRKWHSRYIVMGVGQLNRPQIPALPGLENFQGPKFHSARWDFNVDLKGKNVAVVGTGASAVQFVPEVAKEAATVHLFQRSPNWMIARGDKAYKPWVKWMFRHIPGLMRLYRSWIYWKLEARFAGFHKGALIGHVLKAEASKTLNREIKDPDLKAKLTPDFPVGCKRILISDDYYAALAQDHVSVITSPIKNIEANAVVTEDGTRHPTDVMIFGTGFKTTGFLAPMEITGHGGKKLDDVWQDGAEAFRGTTVSGFPNMFILYGPNTNLGHNSIIFMVERQVEYMMKLLHRMKHLGAASVDVKKDVMDRYNADVQEQLKNSVWDADCGNWYKTKSGKITNNWPSWTVAYWWTMRQPDYTAFEFAKKD